MKFSQLYRPEIIRELQTNTFDLLVIGGGITGAGIALDAQSRGMKVALVEMQDFASGTSSRSTKLIHGGLRYLKQLEFKIVAETGKERAIVYQNGLHITTAQPMLLPIFEKGSLGKFSTNIALWVYDFLAGVKKKEKRKMISVSQTIEMEPLLQKNGLIGGAFYYEYRTDDSRLTIEIAKKAVESGAIILNYAKATGFLVENNRIFGVKSQDQLTGETYEIKAKHIINASGPWVDTIDQLNDASKPPKLQLSKGVHLVVDQQKLPLKQSVYFDVPDGRMIFAIPREGKTYIGTTDNFYSGDIFHPGITNEDIDYLLKATNSMFPNAKIVFSDIESGWSGVRPLIRQQGKSASEISRKDEVFEYDSGLITIAGGKLTGYRKMAERVVNIVSSRLKKEENKIYKPCQTAAIPLSGAITGVENFELFKTRQLETAKKMGLNTDEAKKLIQRYGSNVSYLFEIISHRVPTHGLPVEIFAEVIYSIENEMIAKPLDFFTRRTGSTYFHIDMAKKWHKNVSDLMAEILGWDNETKQKYTSEFLTEINNILPKIS